MIEGPCAYCGMRRAVNRDHVIPKSLLRTKGMFLAKKRDFPLHLRELVPACFECNHRKGTRRLVPPSWECHIDELNELLPGKPWRVWRGGTDEPAYRGTHYAAQIAGDDA